MAGHMKTAIQKPKGMRKVDALILANAVSEWTFHTVFYTNMGPEKRAARLLSIIDAAAEDKELDLSEEEKPIYHAACHLFHNKG